ncbi:MAG: cyclodeaminase/cyclohydrolase family protein [Oscillospiraceae bacterium]|jgi:formiminotetrahydrofolate cyclodeaminase|nr:cyclodeaminase/cyclohydrolase family protein [Oscillospiraceae bacterium]
MPFINASITEFVEVLSSKSPVPGGGGASALVGAVGIALGNMVGSLTVGKKKYADVEQDIVRLQSTAAALQARLLELIDEDAEDFEPLSRAYSIPKDDPTRAEVMESALKTACRVPLEIMRVCAQAIDAIAEFAAKGSSLAVSDAGCGAVCCKAALQGAILNIYINTKSMTDREYSQSLESEAAALLAAYSAKADEVYALVSSKLK